jgi:hypothetical protein
VRFKISQKGKVIGDFAFMDIVDALAEGRFSGKDHFWVQGMAEWMPLKDFAEYNKSHPGGVPASGSISPLVDDDVPDAQEGDLVVAEKRCPSCSSKSVQACGMGFAAGTRTSESLGVSSRGRAYYRAGRSSSILASALAPPAKPNANVFFVLLLLGGLLGSAFWYAKYGPADWRPVNQFEKWSALIASLLAAGGGLWALFDDASRSAEEHAKAMERWYKQWYCKKCGAIFTPASRSE